MLPGVVDREGVVETALGPFRGLFVREVATGEAVDLLLRPDDVIHDDESSFKLEVVDKVFRGAEYLYTLRLEDGGEVLCLVQSHHDHPVGEKIGVRLQVEHLVAFPAKG